MTWIYEADELQIINFDKILFVEMDPRELHVKAFYEDTEDGYITLFEGVEPGDASNWFKSYGKMLGASKLR